MTRGFPLQEIDNWNTGSLVDWAMEHDRLQRRSRGEDVKDPYEQYESLKAMEQQIEQMHAAGQIKEAKYKAYRAALDDCEKKLRE